VSDPYDDGEKLFAAGHFASARKLFDAAVTATPHDIRAYAAVLRIEEIDELSEAARWYGDKPSNMHAVCLLGSVSEQSKRPYVHHASLGRSAYENYQLSYYLRELLRWRRHPSLLQSHFILFYLVAAALGEVQFCELGSTLYAAYEKILNCERTFKLGAINRMDFIGIELAPLLRETSAMLHPDVKLRLVPYWRDIPTNEKPRMAFSLGVANYAFETTGELFEWCAQSCFTILRERFCLTEDFTHAFKGKRFTAFGLDSVADAARRAGFELSLIAAAEPTGFLHEPVNPELRFVDAHLALTQLSPIEHGEFANLIERNGLSAHRRQTRRSKLRRVRRP